MGVPGQQLASPLPLLVTADVELLDDLVRVAAAAGTQLEIAADATAARGLFPHAPIALVGVDVAGACAKAGMSPPPALVVVGRCTDAPPDAWRAAERLGAHHLALLPAAEPWLADRLAAAVSAGPSTGHLVAVLGGRGGAGASVLAAGLAVTGARTGLRTLLIDADPLGGGLDLILGWEALGGYRWPELSSTDPSPIAVEALPMRGELVVLSWDRGEHVPITTAAMTGAVTAARRGRDLTVIDLPRRLDEPARIALTSADRALIVVPAELRACAAAGRVVSDVLPHCRRLDVVVRGPAPGGLRAAEVARSLGVPLAGYMRADTGLSRALERGEPPAGSGQGPLADFCRRFLTELRPTGQAAVA